MLPGCAHQSMCQELVLFHLKRKRKILKMSERSESKRMGAKQHKNSGRNNTKGDASWNNFVIDFKECSKSFTLNQDVWAKATTDALKKSMDPALVIVLGEGTQKVRLAIIELDMLEQLIEENNNGTNKDNT
jgi:outer membrane phospholipase A